MHDFNGGILPSGLFWTIDLRKTAIDFKMDSRRAVLHARNVPLVDTFQIFGPFDTPATVDFRVKWEATGPAASLGSGGSVPATDPAAFLGNIAPARAEGSFSGEEIGFEFESDPGASSARGYAELGTEANGVFV